MTDALSAQHRRWWYAFGWPIVAIVIGGLSIWRFVSMVRTGRVDGLTVTIGVLGTIAILIVLLAIPVIRSGRRLHYLRGETPGVFVCTLAVYPEAAQQFADFVRVSGGSAKHMWGNIWAELWCDGHEMRVYGGTLFGFGGQPKVLVRIPLPEHWRAAIERAQQGLYNMNTLQISATYAEGRGVVNVLPNWSAGVALLPYYKAERMQPFAKQLEALGKNPL